MTLAFLALNRWFDIVEAKLGRPVVDLELLTFECNKDYYGVRIDGVQCVTKKDLYGMVERVYQKEENLVRKEWKVSQPMSVNAFEAAIKKGIGEHDRVQASFELKEEVKRVSEAVKFANSRLYELEKLNTAMFSALTKLVDFTASTQEASKGSEKGGTGYVS